MSRGRKIIRLFAVFIALLISVCPWCAASSESAAKTISDSPSFRRPIAVDAVENDVTVHPKPGADSSFDTKDLPYFDADAYILIDRRTGITICSQNAEDRLYPASTTKIMTAILALELGNMDDLMTASVRAVRDIGPDGSNIGIVAGETMRLDNLLDALLVRSANETANIIAENICDTRDDFLALMNNKAAELGAYNTNFTNASGIHEENHYTTAYDLALIANYAMDNERFRAIVAKRSIILAPTNKHSSWERMSTTNNLLSDTSITGYDVTGVKTGYHSEAGYCVIASGKDNDGMELLCVVLGVHGTVAGTSTKRFKIASDLLSYGFENFEMNTFIRNNERIGTISVLGGENIDTVDVESDGTIKLFMPVQQKKWNVSRIEYIKSEVGAPVKYGDTVGYVEFRNSGDYVGRVNVKAVSDVTAMKGAITEIPNRGNTGSARSAISLTENNAVQTASGVWSLFTSNGGSAANKNSNATVTGSGGDGYYDFYDEEGNAADGAAADAADPKKTPAKGVQPADIFKTVLLIILTLALLVSVLRVVNSIRRNNRTAQNARYHGRLDYPPANLSYGSGRPLSQPDSYRPEQYPYRSNQYRSDQYRPEQYRPEQNRPEQYRSDQYRPEQYRPEQYRPAQYRPDPYGRKNN